MLSTCDLNDDITVSSNRSIIELYIDEEVNIRFDSALDNWPLRIHGHFLREDILHSISIHFHLLEPWEKIAWYFISL